MAICYYWNKSAHCTLSWPWGCGKAGCAGGRGHKPNEMIYQITSQKAQIRATLSPFQTAWTGFNLYIAAGHPQQAPLWWKVETVTSFIFNRGIVTDIMSVLQLTAIIIKYQPLNCKSNIIKYWDCMQI